ncbi:DUF4062 domain-containing protein [Candidatus Methylobacter oryzae]|uniref:DUF4062 domain-containing protein n=1 Tax=Candidatus Methylobacter oryzae TaxID=2497749 RepID=A0ABY3C719_9GAMM|nr:DUF4062 domain-containing protein [Candidatus Methylobacter oryzae]TRW91368.1 DUF4062 domain-containing protein [Candidatus Methylobacter oryzae]
MEKRYQVFVSSTYADLKDERHKVIQTLMELDCIPAGMELFPATDEDQFEFIKRIIDDCDYYLLIIGGRYGSITTQGISYTEQEYEYALERGLKVIALLHENPNQIPFDKSEQDPELRARLQSFRGKVATGRIVKFWPNAEALPGIVALSLPKTIKMFPAIGWVRADKVSNEELLVEINELRKQNAEFSKALSEVEPSIFTGSEEKDFAYIYSSLNRLENIEVAIKQGINSKAEVLNKKYSINLASLIPFIATSDSHEYKWYLIVNIILSEIPLMQTEVAQNFWIAEIKNLADDLKMYGFLTKNYIPPVSNNNELRSIIRRRGDEYRLIYSEKLERYKYWLNVNGKMPKYIEINEKPE